MDISCEPSQFFTHPAHNAHIGTFIANYTLDNAQNIALQHAHKAHGAAIATRPILLDGQLAQALDEEHDVGARVHVGSLELLEDARVQVLVHVAVLERIEGGLLQRRVRRAEMRQQRREALAHFERVRHGCGCWRAAGGGRCGRPTTGGPKVCARMSEIEAYPTPRSLALHSSRHSTHALDSDSLLCHFTHTHTHNGFVSGIKGSDIDRPRLRYALLSSTFSIPTPQ
jgi:hypothetical protein